MINKEIKNDAWLIKNNIWIALYRQGYDIRVEYKIPEISTRIADYDGKPYFKYLKRIYDFLSPYDKSKNFLKTGRIGHSGHLEDCDIFLGRSNQVVELDEKQHFNSLRGEVLDLYPTDMPLAFNRKEYRGKCGKKAIGKNENIVSIWNDVLRDFLPWIAGINPTARIDVTAISTSVTDMPARAVLDYIRASDRAIEFYEEKKGVISSLQYKDSLSRNVDEEKNVIYRYLLDRYEKVFWGYPSGQFVNINEYATRKEIYPCLKKIYVALENHRNGKIIIGRKKLANCDIYIPEEHVIVELDEVRHFTELRAVSLKYYPKELTIAFNKEEYFDFCNQIKAKDDDAKKPYRDEQRAWFDVLRDFLPLIDGKYKPVIRIPLFETKRTGLRLDKEAIIQRLENGLRIQ
jgi:hypothetical protein